MSIEAKLEFFAETRHAYGRTALMLSGGAAFGKFHFGVLKALWECDMMPRIICGSSIGSCVATVIATLPISETYKAFEPEYFFYRPIVGRFQESAMSSIKDLLSGKPVFDSEVIKTFIKGHAGDLTFKEAFSKFGWNLNITVTDFSITKASRLLNYLSAPNVVIWSAVCASCAIPGLFPKNELM